MYRVATYALGTCYWNLGKGSWEAMRVEGLARAWDPMYTREWLLGNGEREKKRERERQREREKRERERTCRVSTRAVYVPLAVRR